MTSPGLSELPTAEFAFPGPLRDQLVGAILSGEKTATSSLLAEYVDEPLPQVGDVAAVLDSAGNRVCAIRTTAVRVVPLGEVDDEHAEREGEGYADAAAWREGHERFWNSPEMRAELGDSFVLDDDTPVVCEDFHLVAGL